MGGGFARGDKKTEDGSLTWENTIYVAGLPTDVTAAEIAEFFGRIGQIKKSKKNYNLGEVSSTPLAPFFRSALAPIFCPVN